MWIRTCQECNHKQQAKPPASYVDPKQELWRNTRCKKCASQALDYGKEVGDVTFRDEDI